MIEVKFTGDSMAALRAQIVDFLGESPAATVPQSAPAAGKKGSKAEAASSASGAGTVAEAGTTATGDATSAEKAGDGPLTVETGAASSAASAGRDGSTAGTATKSDASQKTEITYEDIRTMVLRLSVAKGRDAVFEFLGQFDAKKTAQEIDPSKYGDAMAVLKTLVEG